MSTIQNYPALPIFAISLIALLLKATLLSTVQVVARFRSKQFLLPEDAALANSKAAASESRFVQICGNVWRNDCENLPLFFALALTYTLLGASTIAAQWLFYSYILIRGAHTLAYLLRKQPYRALLYLSSMAICWAIAVNILMRLL